ncbi:uncharacterized protein UTRI_10389_B [Ustilago trichophora]|uniref:Uncharacterized protein n=1 Tax=Ustilago trichophora TaxID=86804 RepID=A0A5C3E9R8_9BASI|nr:uncharacterized protein UTRI_10389_B [Ustilago trichophora]
MVPNYRVLRRFLFFIALPIVSALSSHHRETDIDWLMRSRSYGHQAIVFRQADAKWKQARRSIEPDVPKFAQRALKQAAAGSVYVGTHRPVIRNSKRRMGLQRVKVFGPKELYFYHVIEPEQDLGKDMELFDGTVATVLWKHVADPPSFHLLNVDVIKKPANVKWGFQKLNDIFRHH